jgi:putative pyruvate formate lyase activating enzyme
MNLMPDPVSSGEPVYLDTFQSGLLDRKVKAAHDRLICCTLCPRRCGIDRTAGQTGVCKTGQNAFVSSYNAHFGEEAPLVGRKGSGTIFFTHCNLMCSFCQNYDISHEGSGIEVSADQIADMMLALQNAGCHNINFVTPSHVVPQILSSVEKAIRKGLNVPLVFNTGAYDRVETLKLLEGVFDIYMPDFKFWNPQLAEATCSATDYPEVARAAIVEMHRQVGDLVIDESGLAKRGLLVRHLVLPNGAAGTREIMRFLAQKISPDTYVNIMDQYRPCGRAAETEGLSRGLTRKEYQAALVQAEEEGITRLDAPRRVFMIR